MLARVVGGDGTVDMWSAARCVFWGSGELLHAIVLECWSNARCCMLHECRARGLPSHDMPHWSLGGSPCVWNVHGCVVFAFLGGSGNSCILNDHNSMAWHLS